MQILKYQVNFLDVMMSYAKLVQFALHIPDTANPKSWIEIVQSDRCPKCQSSVDKITEDVQTWDPED